MLTFNYYILYYTIKDVSVTYKIKKTKLKLYYIIPATEY